MGVAKWNFPYTGPFPVIKVGRGLGVGQLSYSKQNRRESPFTVYVDDLKHYYGNENPTPWINGLGQPGYECVESVGELPVTP